VDGGLEAGCAGSRGENPEHTREHAVFGLGAARGFVGGVGAALGEQDGDAFRAEVDLEVPVVVVVRGGDVDVEVGFEDPGGACAGEE
jgi:hypothetical protein